MQEKSYLISLPGALLIAALVTSLATFTVTAGKPPSGIKRKMINITTLKNISADKLTAITVELNPGVRVPTHTHEGFVFVYVLKGTIRSQLNNGKTVEYTTGQSWTEAPGTIHTFSSNPSTTDKVKFLAVFLAKDGSKLTNFEVKH